MHVLVSCDFALLKIRLASPKSHTIYYPMTWRKRKNPTLLLQKAVGCGKGGVSILEPIKLQNDISRLFRWIKNVLLWREESSPRPGWPDLAVRPQWRHYTGKEDIRRRGILRWWWPSTGFAVMVITTVVKMTEEEKRCQAGVIKTLAGVTAVIVNKLRRCFLRNQVDFSWMHSKLLFNRVVPEDVFLKYDWFKFAIIRLLVAKWPALKGHDHGLVTVSKS